MEITYLVAQGCGLLATAVCLILPLWKRKWQMLVCNAFSNLFAGANIVLLGQASVLPVYVIAILQVFVTLWHLRVEKPIAGWENILFLVLYVTCGLAGVEKALDLMPVFGAVFNMLATFQLREQRSRWFVLGNALVFNVYYFIIGSTAIFSTVIATISTVVALYKYRDRKIPVKAGK